MPASKFLTVTCKPLTMNSLKEFCIINEKIYVSGKMEILYIIIPTIIVDNCSNCIVTLGYTTPKIILQENPINQYLIEKSDLSCMFIHPIYSCQRYIIIILLFFM